MTVPDNRRILLVDDNPELHKGFRKIFIPAETPELSRLETELFGSAESPSGVSFTIASAYQGQQALTLVQEANAQKKPFAMAFVDVRMPPGWDGIETIQHLWKEAPDLEVVICTAYSDYDWESVRRLLGETDRLLILKKPFDNIEVRQMALALTEKWRLRAEAQIQREGLEALVQERTRNLEESRSRLIREIGERREAEVALQWRQRYQEALNHILELSLEDLSLEISLQQSFDEICSLQWTQFEPRGSIFLADGEKKELQICAQKDLSVDLLHQCARVPFGECFCGMAAAQRRPVIGEHNGRCPCPEGEVARNHGHLCLPILVRGTLHGVLNLYLKTGVPENHEERRSLQALVDAVANIIEHKRDQEALTKAKEMAETINQAKSVFLSTVSHEIRTPLSCILGFVQLLRQDLSSLGTLPDELKTAVDAIEQCGRTLQFLTSDILDVARIETGHFELLTEVFDPGKLLEQVLLPMRLKAEEKGLQFTLETAGLPTSVKGDARRLRQIVFNLTGNALKFTEKGSLCISCGLEKNFLHLEIADTGIGIPKEAQSRLFTPFFQADRSSVRRLDGTGLGLSIVKQLLDRMGGTVSIQSEEGVGTTLTVRFPLES